MTYRRTDRYAGNWYVKNGRIVLKRDMAGEYRHEAGQTRRRTDSFERFRVFRFGPDAAAPGLWGWAREGFAADDVHATKADAVHSLQQHLYGEYSFDDDYNR